MKPFKGPLWFDLFSRTLFNYHVSQVTRAIFCQHSPSDWLNTKTFSQVNTCRIMTYYITATQLMTSQLVFTMRHLADCTYFTFSGKIHLIKHFFFLVWKVATFCYCGYCIYCSILYSLARQNKELWQGLFHNSQYVCSIYGQTDQEFADAGNTVLLHLKENDQITIRAQRNNSLYGDEDQIYSTFSGTQLATEADMSPGREYHE